MCWGNQWSIFRCLKLPCLYVISNTRLDKMAEGEQVAGRKKDLMSNCSPCNDKGTEKTAVNYCFKCEASFCHDCTDQHSSLLSKHKVTDIESARVGVPLALQTELCPKHGKAFRLFCKDHDSICCEECFDREHL